jgi:hypothetical protein
VVQTQGREIFIQMGRMFEKKELYQDIKEKSISYFQKKDRASQGDLMTCF